MAAEMFAGIGALKSAFDLAKAVKEIDDAAKRNSAVIDLQQAILDAQSAQQEILKRSELLERRIQELEAWETESEGFTLHAAARKIVTYAPKRIAVDDDLFFQLCPSCFHSRYKSILVSATWTPGRAEVLICHACGWHAYLVGMAMPEHQKLAPKPYRGP